jgi:hypothetical protein
VRNLFAAIRSVAADGSALPWPIEGEAAHSPTVPRTAKARAGGGSPASGTRSCRAVPGKYGSSVRRSYGLDPIAHRDCRVEHWFVASFPSRGASDDPPPIFDLAAQFARVFVVGMSIAAVVSVPFLILALLL